MKSFPMAAGQWDLKVGGILSMRFEAQFVARIVYCMNPKGKTKAK